MGDSSTPGSTIFLQRLWPLVIIALATGPSFGFGLDSHVDLAVLRESRAAFQEFAANHAVLAVLAYIGAYIAITVVSCLAASLLTLPGGFLFGFAGAAVHTVIGATVGATLVFMAAKSSLGEPLRWRTEGFCGTWRTDFPTMRSAKCWCCV